MPRKGFTDRQLAEFPFLRRLTVEMWDLHPLAPGSFRPGDTSHRRLDRLDFKISRADADLFWRQGHNELGEGEWVGAIKPQERGMDAKQGEYLYVVTNGSVHPVSFTRYPRNVFQRYAFNAVTHLVWVTMLAWYKQQSSEERRPQPTREFVRRAAEVTLYKPPAQGFAELYRTAHLSDTNLSSYDITRGVLDKDPEFLAIVTRLEKLAKDFERKVYRQGLRARMRSWEVDTQINRVHLVGVTARGRTQVILKMNNAEVGFNGLEEGPPQLSFGFIAGSVSQAEEMVEKVIAGWRK